jgi:hypothetical protein
MNILLTSVGRRGYLVQYFKSALNQGGKVFAANSVYSSTLTLADEYVLTPLIYSPEYIDFLLDYARKKQIGAIIPLFDIDAGVLASNKARFEDNGIRIITGSAETLALCNDKWKMFLFLSEHGISTPKTFLSFEGCLQAIQEREITFPIIVKPRWGMGSIGIYTADTEDELIVFGKKLKRQIFKTYLKYESQQDQDRCVIFQEMIPGTEFGLDVINDLQGQYILTSVKRKLAMRAGETDVAITVRVPALEKIGERLSALMRHSGNLDVDCFLVDGQPCVLEMNCRFGGQFPFSYLAGTDLPRQIVRWLEGKSTDLSLLTPRIGVLAAKELAPSPFIFALSANNGDIDFVMDQASGDELAEFYVQCSDYFQPPLAERVDIRALAEKNRRNGFSIEARHHGMLVGLVLGYANDHVHNNAYIPFVIVKKEFRKRGLAQTLLKDAISYAQIHGMRKITLTTDEWNDSALHLYQRCGFHEVQRISSKIHLQIEL